MAIPRTEIKGTYQIQGLYKGYVREYPQKIWSCMVQYLHFNVLQIPRISWKLHGNSWLSIALNSKTIVSKVGSCWFQIDFVHLSLPRSKTIWNCKHSKSVPEQPETFNIKKRKSVADLVSSFKHFSFQFFLLFPHLAADARSFLSREKHGLFQQVSGTASWCPGFVTYVRGS